MQVWQAFTHWTISLALCDTFYKAKGLREQNPQSGCGCLTQMQPLQKACSDGQCEPCLWSVPVSIDFGTSVVNVGAYFAKRKLGFQGSKEKFTVWPSRNPYGSIREERSKKWVKGQVIHASTLTVSALVWGFPSQLRKHALNHTAERDENKNLRTFLSEQISVLGVPSVATVPVNGGDNFWESDRIKDYTGWQLRASEAKGHIKCPPPLPKLLTSFYHTSSRTRTHTKHTNLFLFCEIGSHIAHVDLQLTIYL